MLVWTVGLSRLAPKQDGSCCHGQPPDLTSTGGTPQNADERTRPVDLESPPRQTSSAAKLRATRGHGSSHSPRHVRLTPHDSPTTYSPPIRHFRPPLQSRPHTAKGRPTPARIERTTLRKSSNIPVFQVGISRATITPRGPLRFNLSVRTRTLTSATGPEVSSSVISLKHLLSAT